MNKLYFEVRSDLYLAGRCPEEGTEQIAEVFFVIAENDAGRRWAHEARFRGATTRIDEEGLTRVVFTRNAAERAVNRLLARIEAAGKIDFARWAEIDPAYGSDEYVAQGTEEQRWMVERCEALGSLATFI